MRRTCRLLVAVVLLFPSLIPPLTVASHLPLPRACLTALSDGDSSASKPWFCQISDEDGPIGPAGEGVAAAEPRALMDQLLRFVVAASRFARPFPLV